MSSWSVSWGSAASHAIRPHEDIKAPVTKRQHENGDTEPDGSVETYKSFWSKFKRPSRHDTPDPAESPEPKKDNTEVASTPKTDEAIVASRVSEPEEAGLTTGHGEKPAETPRKDAAAQTPVFEVEDASPTLPKEIPDNQLGDSSLYPPTPLASPAPTSLDVKSDSKDGVDVADTADQDGDNKPLEPLPAVPSEAETPEPKATQSLPPFSPQGLSPEFMQEMDRMFGPSDERIDESKMEKTGKALHSKG